MKKLERNDGKIKDKGKFRFKEQVKIKKKDKYKKVKMLERKNGRNVQNFLQLCRR